MKPQKSDQIALGGVFSALCLVLMFLSSVIPFSSFALPMLAGAMLMVVVIENGAKTAFLVYISVSLLSAFIVPDVDTKLMFILFFGYYPVFRPSLEKIPGKLLSMLAKLLLLNAAMIPAYYLSLMLTGLEDAASDSEFLGQYAPLVLLAGMNFSFLIYNFVLTKYTAIYLGWFRPKFLRR